MKQISLSFKTTPFEKTPVFWKKVFPLMKKHLRLDNEYMTSIDRKRVKCHLTKIDAYTSDESKNERSYFITNSINGTETTQSFLHGELRGDAKFTLQANDYITSYQEFADDLIQVFDISNLLIHDSGSCYKRSLRAFFSPPNSDLYSGPGLVNTHYRNFLEGVTADMWFGEAFWQYAVCSKEELISQDWLTVRHLQKGVVHVRSWPVAFTTAEGHQGEVQRKLLKLLFNIDGNRPHGNYTAEESGTYQQSVLVSKDGKVLSKTEIKERRH